MTESRALPDLVARIKVDSSGLDSALSNMTSSIGKVTPSMIGLGAAIGILVMGGKSMVENAEKAATAHAGLKQAADATGQSFTTLQTTFDTWVQANKKYIPDQYDAEAALAAFTRAGNSAGDSMRLLNDALDLSIIKHEPMTEAEHSLELALMGNGRALKELGISSDEYNKIMHDKLLTTEQKHIELLDLIETKTKGGRKAQSDLSQSSNQLNIDWQTLSAVGGPILLGVLDWVAKGATAVFDELNKIGHDDAMWATISDRLVKMGNWIHDYVLGPAADVSNFFNAHGGTGGDPGRPMGYPGRAGGGPVLPNSIYTVGEHGPETLVMGSSGGMVIPGRGGGSGATVINHYNITGVGADIVANVKAINDQSFRDLRAMLRNGQLEIPG